MKCIDIAEHLYRISFMFDIGGAFCSHFMGGCFRSKEKRKWNGRESENASCNSYWTRSTSGIRPRGMQPGLNKKLQRSGRMRSSLDGLV